VPAPVYEQAMQAMIAELRDGLKNLGWIEGRNLRLEIRYAADPKEIGPYADELVKFAPDVIVVGTSLMTATVQQRTRTIPIVFIGVGDPVEGGMVKSLARPEGNTTGITNLFFSIGSKWLEFIKDAAPGVARAAILLSRDTRVAGYVASIEAAGTALGVQTIRTPYGNAAELERVIDAFAAEPNGSLILHPPGLFGTDRELMFRLAIEHRLPAIYQQRTYALEGGLMSYGSNPLDLFRQSASYVDHILRGDKPGDLPVQFPTKFELVLNLKTAKAMGLTISEAVLNLADEVIE
jgi:putative tryptophan/tyrosine transport system substrate-binding protein